ncbi:hypothetical protein [Amycolatopsis rubida]|uniref:Uncharacterized protein n=1 Tax=Amycolatopsis rubida TaxID=112413 RepID=A0A1I5DZQ8_9PSEU|nr:hypothetical protein [Amycolatopsis rubida]SFO04764.1 hypothetical protein SAMN05421854_101426 [Amycolatopsis rubida]
MTAHATDTEGTPPEPLCPDCEVGIGQYHLEGCDLARCLANGRQRLAHDPSCGCPQDVWTGRWPGEAECEEFGWMIGPGLHDILRLYATAVWDPDTLRWTLPPGHHDTTTVEGEPPVSTLAAASDSPAGTGLAAGECWIEFVPAARAAEPHQASFPAVVESRRHHGLWVRPRLRREVAEEVCQWLNVVYPIDPDWYPLARFEDDLLVVFTGQGARRRHEIAVGEDGRYPLGDLGRWFLSAPTRTLGRFYRQLELLRDAERRRPRSGETLVTCDPSRTSASGFPARLDAPPGQARVPVFRPEIAEAVAAWCTTSHGKDPDRHPLAYFDGGTLVHVHQHQRAFDGYLPWRIEPDLDGNYRIDGDQWTFRTVPAKSEGTVCPSAAAPEHRHRS